MVVIVATVVTINEICAKDLVELSISMEACHEKVLMNSKGL